MKKLAISVLVLGLMGVSNVALANAEMCLNANIKTNKANKAEIINLCKAAFQSADNETDKFKFNKQACLFGDYFSCVAVAYRYENGYGVKHNHKKSIEYLNIADKIACGKNSTCIQSALKQNKTLRLPQETKTMIAQNPEHYPLVIYSDPKIQKVYTGLAVEEFLHNIGVQFPQ